MFLIRSETVTNTPLRVIHTDVRFYCCILTERNEEQHAGGVLEGVLGWQVDGFIR